MLSERVIARWQRSVAFMKAMNLLHKAIRLVLYPRTTMAIKMASELGTFFKRVGRRAYTEQVVA